MDAYNQRSLAQPHQFGVARRQVEIRSDVPQSGHTDAVVKEPCRNLEVKVLNNVKRQFNLVNLEVCDKSMIVLSRLFS